MRTQSLRLRTEDIQTNRQTGTKHENTEHETDKQTKRQIDRQTETKHENTEHETDKQTNRQIDRKIEKQIGPHENTKA
jgi:hypothetical protein